MRLASRLLFACSLLLPALRAADATDAALKSAGLNSTQLLEGLKAGLGTLVQVAGTELAKPGAVDVATPTSMAKLESTLRRLNQSGAFEGFKASLNQAAAAVAPETTAALKSAIGPLTLADARSLIGGPPDAATQLLRKSADAALRTKLMPLVAQAIAANGTAAKAKDLLSKAGPMAAMMGVPGTADLEKHLYTQVLDALSRRRRCRACGRRGRNRRRRDRAGRCR
jgi:hypothetical protein